MIIDLLVNELLIFQIEKKYVQLRFYCLNMIIELKADHSWVNKNVKKKYFPEKKMHENIEKHQRYCHLICFKYFKNGDFPIIYNDIMFTFTFKNKLNE